MHDPCETPRCPRCDVPLALPIERNSRSGLDGETHICGNCAVTEWAWTNVTGKPLPSLNQRIEDLL